MFDREYKKSLKYGYLNFYQKEDAQKCLDEQKNAEIDGKVIQLSWKKESDFDTKANVLCKNLPKDLTQKGLQDLLVKFGTIISCKLEVFSNGGSRCFGYVQFEKQESALAAIAGLNGTSLGDDGKKLEITQHIRKGDREDGGDMFTNLFV
jgi:polyadenylate-binding protein